MGDVIDFPSGKKEIETEWGTDWLDFDGISLPHSRVLWNQLRSADCWLHYNRMVRRNQKR